MLPDVTTLLILQERDQKLRRLRLELKKAPEDEARAKTRLADADAALKAVKEQVTANEIAMKKLEIDIETRRTTIGRLKTQQFETRKNDEYKALEHEIDRYGREVTGLEDQELVLMEKAEGLKQETARAMEVRARVQQLVDEELKQLAGRVENSRTQITEIEADRAGVAAKVNEALLQRYDRLFEKKAPAVVELENGVCGGCHMKVTAATLSAVRADKVIASCENCGRILYGGY